MSALTLIVTLLEKAFKVKERRAKEMRICGEHKNTGNQIGSREKSQKNVQSESGGDRG